ncbi:MAG: hypothetical protein NTW86_04795 [Candidatus Sumerlaeota bacterium]|nr:hypothetical protein [Candidatus Sumerlaeota bacterium]
MRYLWINASKSALLAFVILASGRSSPGAAPDASHPVTFDNYITDAQGRVVRKGYKPIAQIAEECREQYGAQLDVDAILHDDIPALQGVIRDAWAKAGETTRPPMGPDFAAADLACLRLAAWPTVDGIRALLALTPSAPPCYLFHVYNDLLWPGFDRGPLSTAKGKEEWTRVIEVLIDGYARAIDSQPTDILFMGTGPYLGDFWGKGPRFWESMHSHTFLFITQGREKGVLDEEAVRSLLQSRIENPGAFPKAVPFLKEMLYLMETTAARKKGLRPTPTPDPGIPHYQPTRESPNFALADSRFMKLLGYLEGMGSEGFYPNSLDDLLANFPEWKLQPQDIIDPLDPQGRPFYYESDGGHFILKTQAPVDFEARAMLSARSKQIETWSKEEAAQHRATFEARRPLREEYRARWREQQAKPPTPADYAVDKAEILDLALEFYKRDYGQYPKTLDALTSDTVKSAVQIPGQRRLTYFDLWGSTASATKEALERGGMAPPDGYVWFYDTRDNGQEYFLGLRKEGAREREIDAANMPVAWSGGRGKIYPAGKNAEVALKVFLENRPPTPEEKWYL